MPYPLTGRIHSGLTTLTLGGSSGAEKIWAFTQMACTRPRLRPVSGLRFSPFDPALTAGRIAILTRTENWYREELLPCFVSVASEGRWQGIDPLKNER